MQNHLNDSVIAVAGVTRDTSGLKGNVFFETRPARSHEIKEHLYSPDLGGSLVPDWFFIILVVILGVAAWARIAFSRFLSSVFVSGYSYQAACKSYKEQGLVQRRFGIGLDMLYMVNASLFLYLLNVFFVTIIFDTKGIFIVFIAFAILCFLVLSRIFVMRIIGLFFNRRDLFLEFLHHFFIYNKIIGLVLIPFLIAIPYSQGKLQEIIIYTGISLVIIVYVLRLFRAFIFAFKNVVLFLYLILYLCILEIIPFLVVFKLLLSMAKV